MLVILRDEEWMKGGRGGSGDGMVNIGLEMVDVGVCACIKRVCMRVCVYIRLSVCVYVCVCMCVYGCM